MKKWMLWLFALVLMVGVAQLSLVPAVSAQPMEEEEEEMMPYPNPLEKNMKGASTRMLKGKEGVQKAGQQVMQKGKALGEQKGINSNGINSNGINSNGQPGMGQGQAGKGAEMLNNPDEVDMGKGMGVVEGVGNMKKGSASAGSTKGYVKKKLIGMDDTPNPMENQAAMGLGDGGEDTPDNPVNPVTTGAANAYGWDDTDDTPTDPVNPVGWDPTDMNMKKDISTEFGGQMNVGEGY